MSFQEKKMTEWMKTGLEIVAWMLVFAAALFWSDVWAGTRAVEAPWRIAVHEAACIAGERVTLGEIASPVGQVNEQAWLKMAGTELWRAPNPGRPMSVNKDKLGDALAYYLGDLAALCTLPPTLTLQRGGKVYTKEKLADRIVKALTEHTAGLTGDVTFRDYRAPEHIFLEDRLNTLRVEPRGEVDAGRVGLRITEVGPDGSDRRSYSASVFMDHWVTVPAASRPLNRGDALTPDKVTHIRKNLAHLRSDLWDGRGGPWRVRRSVGAEQVIEMSDIEPLPVISKGDTVTLVFQGPFIRLEAAAEALDDASLGDTVAVRNLQSKRQVYGKVHDADTVYVQ